MSSQLSLLDIVNIVPDFFLDVVKLLDPACLKNLRCVSKDWNCFIVECVWNNMRGRKILLNLAWRKRNASIREFRNDNRDAAFFEIGCDQENVWCSTKGFLEVIDIASGSKWLKLDCLPASVRGDHPKEKNLYVWMLIDVGKDSIVVCATDMTKSDDEKYISIFDKKTGDLSYQAKPYNDHPNTQIITLKIFDNVVVTGDVDGTIVLLEKGVTGEWEFKWKMLANDNGSWVRHLDVDRDWLVVADKLCIKIWTLSQLHEDATSKPTTVLHEGVDTAVPLGCVAINVKYPFIFFIGGVDWDGYGLDGDYSLQVWNGISGEQIRSVEMQSQFLFIKSNSDFLFICDGARFRMGEECIFIFNIEELCDGSIPDNQLWRRGLVIDDWQLVEVNQTCLITSGAFLLENAADVVIHQFWN